MYYLYTLTRHHLPPLSHVITYLYPVSYVYLYTLLPHCSLQFPSSALPPSESLGRWEVSRDTKKRREGGEYH